MKILLLSFFYPPDIGPGSFRAKTFTDALQKYGPSDLKIDVITTFPSRQKVLTAVDEIEQHDNLTVYRVKIPAIKPNFIFQFFVFFYFAIKTLIKVRSKSYDIVIATSARSGTATLGALIAHFKLAKFYLDLREIFPENIKDIFKGYKGKVLSKIFSLPERWAINTADKVNLISPGFLPYYQSTYPGRTFSCYMHAVDPLFAQTLTSAPVIAGSRLKVCYAGNVGYGQQLHLILPELAQRTKDRCDFYIIGGGNNLTQLEQALKDKNITNVQLLPGVPRKELIAQYQNADILFLHIYPYPFAQRILPSKLFEYAATGKPIWAGVTGYSAQFIAKEIANCAVFTPCDADDALAALPLLKLDVHSRQSFLTQFNQDTLMRNLASAVLSLRS